MATPVIIQIKTSLFRTFSSFIIYGNSWLYIIYKYIKANSLSIIFHRICFYFDTAFKLHHYFSQKIDFPGKIVMQLEPKQFGITGAVDNDQSPFALGNFVHGNHQADRQTGNLIFQQVIAQNLLCNGNDPAGNLIGKGVILPDFRHQHGALAKCKVMVCQHGENMIPERRAVGKIKTVCFLKIEKKAVGNFVHLLILELLHDGGMEKPLVTELLKHTNPVFLG